MEGRRCGAISSAAEVAGSVHGRRRAALKAAVAALLLSAGEGREGRAG
jgi:hypothetical protein